jgi:hypothetical protein
VNVLNTLDSDRELRKVEKVWCIENEDERDRDKNVFRREKCVLKAENDSFLEKIEITKVATILRCRE